MKYIYAGNHSQFFKNIMVRRIHISTKQDKNSNIKRFYSKSTENNPSPSLEAKI